MINNINSLNISCRFCTAEGPKIGAKQMYAAYKEYYSLMENGLKCVVNSWKDAMDKETTMMDKPEENTPEAKKKVHFHPVAYYVRHLKTC